MKIHEFQAKQLFREFGVPIPDGAVAETREKAASIADDLGYPCMIKAQIHAGGRGKSGGIQRALNREEAERFAGEILGMRLINPQTGPAGKTVRRVLVERGLEIAGELYLALLVDREKECPVIIASPNGGVDIEETANRDPGTIFRVPVHPVTRLWDCHIRTLSFKLGLNESQRKNFAVLLANLYRLFEQKDLSLAEINPLVVTDKDEILALDAKLTFDDNALFRHPEIATLRDVFEEEPLEVEADRFGLNYIKLNGDIGCMVNGAGLAMATMDIIKYYGGEPANFLDVGGGTSVDRVKEAFHILLADTSVRAILVNIFGGIVRTDLVASGMVNATRETDIRVPIVVRLVGTNEEEGRRILRESGIHFIVENHLGEAVGRVVELARRGAG